MDVQNSGWAGRFTFCAQDPLVSPGQISEPVQNDSCISLFLKIFVSVLKFCSKTLMLVSAYKTKTIDLLQEHTHTLIRQCSADVTMRSNVTVIDAFKDTSVQRHRLGCPGRVYYESKFRTVNQMSCLQGLTGFEINLGSSILRSLRVFLHTVTKRNGLKKRKKLLQLRFFSCFFLLYEVSFVFWTSAAYQQIIYQGKLTEK